ncbi:class I SAM-dependent methyltransferase [Thalassovita mangrovi]|uniref:Methyltransferase domain-containing protein n=1 Tax=Thalassovita mangrovi TaxID=2692236 RepID=A0A6L8LM10_9RHOB|nr:class I SAM-dependent methyltransferase [Thalassovita mangrovi]MYM56046.1 methyltransferase domain-containing protein [Thalassovita mangrovi]
MTDAETKWENTYQSKSADALGWFEARPETSLKLIARSGVAHDAALIDIGAGASRLTDCLLDLGFLDLTALDLSQAALQATRDRLPEDAPVTWIAGDMLRWRPERRYALWHDRAALHFLTDPADQAAYRDTLDRALAAGGFAVIGTFAPDGPDKCSGQVVEKYDAAKLMALLGPDFRLIEELRHTHVTPGGTEQRFFYALVQKRPY